MLQRLHRTAGNQAVRSLVGPPAQARKGAATVAGPTTTGGAGGGAVGGALAPATTESALPLQRYAGILSAPVPPAPPAPTEDPRFAKVVGKLSKAAKSTKKHDKPTAAAKKAQAAAKAPSDDKLSQAKAAQVAKMGTAKPGTFDKKAFIAAVKAAIAKAAPKNLDEADSFAGSGRADAVKGEVSGKVTEGKKTAAQDVVAKEKEPPDQSKSVDKPVTPLEPQKVQHPADLKAGDAMPAKAPPEQLDFRGPKVEADAEMKDAGVSEQALAKSNEPQLQGALEAKKAGEEHSKKAPGEVRKAEAETLKSATAGAQQDGKTGLQALHGAASAAAKKVGSQQGATKSKDEQKRQQVSAKLNGIYEKAKTEVEGILNGLDDKVSKTFDDGEGAARRKFTADHKRRMDEYKSRRYSGWTGAAKWLKDKFAGLPDEANQIFQVSKAQYERDMEVVISNVADVVGGELTRAKNRIAQGRAEVEAEVKRLPKDLQKFGQDAAKDIASKFDDLDKSVDDKQQQLADDLAQKYVDARNAVDDEIKEAQEANKGLWDKAKDAIKGAIAVIKNLKNLFLSILAKAADAFTRIIADPVKFISNFFTAVKTGFMNFASNIYEHLKKGLKDWLFGQLAEGGLEIPDKLDAKGIFQMILSILGLTWANIRSRLVKAIGEPAMAAIEKTVDVFKTIATQGVIGLWKWIVDKLGDLTDMVLGPIKQFVIEKIVKAGITWLIGLLNPAGALVKIVQALVSVVQWLFEKGEALVDLIRTVIDAVHDIAFGGLGGVPKKIEEALAKAVPVVISFLASLLGLGGIGEKVKSVISAVQKPVNKAVDFVIKGALKIARPLINAFKRGAGFAKKKIQQGKDWAKKKVDQGKKLVKEKAQSVKDWTKQKVQGGFAFVKGLLGLPKAEKLSMAGAGHTVTMDATKNHVSLVMASAPADLFSKIATEHDVASRSGDNVRVAAITSIGRLAGAIRQAGTTAVGSPDEASAKKAARRIDKLMKALGRAISSYGTKYGVHDFGDKAGKVMTPTEKLAGDQLDHLALEAGALVDVAVQKQNKKAADEARAIVTEAKAAKTTDEPHRVKVVAKLTPLLTAVRAKLGIKGAAGEDLYWDQSKDGIVGEVGKHGDQGSRGRSNGRPSELWLESEHVIPRGWLNLYLLEHHNKAITDDFYHRMTTVLLYASASKMKTNQDKPPTSGAGAGRVGGFAKSSDNPTLAAMKKVLAGNSQGRNAAADLKALRDNLRTLLDSRVSVTMTAVKVDHATHGPARAKAKAPEGPTESQVRLAASRQLAEVDGYIGGAEGTRTASGAKLSNVSVPVTMDGEKHTLIYTPPGKLEMASTRGVLIDKLQQSLAALSSGDPKPELQIKHLTGVLRLAERVEQAMAAAEAISKDLLADDKDAPPQLKKLQAEIAALANALDFYAGKYHKKDLPKEAEGHVVGIPEDTGKTAKDLEGTDLYKKFGMPARNALQALKVAGQFDVVLLVRPTNPTAPVLLEQGALPKPQEIKAKTINSDDVVLGANAGITKADIGKVGFFKPELPPQGAMSEDAYRKLYTRFVQRQKEQADDARKIQSMIKKGKIDLSNGKIIDRATQKEFTGDHDLYAILDANERPMVDLPGETKFRQLKDRVVAALQSGSFRAQHGAHLDWTPKDAVEKRIFNVIVQAHQSGEPLLKVTSSGCSLTFHKPVYMAGGQE
ncbi:MAG TPA: hypothetical protein VHN98_07450 [Acidimicrobiales bacterium]|nr:hypothetical protein [Acidimicrobiales bacterium]